MSNYTDADCVYLVYRCEFSFTNQTALHKKIKAVMEFLKKKRGEISWRLPNSPTQRLVCFVCYVGSHKAFCTFFSLLKVALSALVVLYRWVRELDLSPLTVSTLLKGSTPLEPRLYSLFIITGIVPMAMESDLFRTVVKLFHKD